MDIPNIQTDVIIVGAGLAGTYLALNLPEEMHITLLSSYDDNSSLAQGGIASCIKKEDSFDAHFDDTMTAGHYINASEAVKHLVEEGPEHIERLLALGVDFDKTNQGQINATLEGGHSHHRVLHIDGDQTGKGIMTTLKNTLDQRSNIHQVHNATLVRLLRQPQYNKMIHHLQEETDAHITGVVYDQNYIRHTLHSTYVVLATGGMGDLFSHTTNKSGAYGSGIALADSIGVEVRDLRFMQFHPTAFHSRTSNRFFLVSEAVRGEGAYLLDYKHRRFMPSLHPQAELAPRDIVSKAIFQVLSKSPKDYVYLDTRHIETDYLSKRFPNISSHLQSHGLTFGEDLIPVTPVAHYTVGGITTDAEGRTSLPNLYACGEVASTGVHGANRLASNSLLECLVYGHRVATSIRESEKAYAAVNAHRCIRPAKATSSPSTDTGLSTSVKVPLDSPTTTRDLSSMVKDIQSLMTKHVGIRRTDEGLHKALKTFKKLESKLETLNTHSLLACEVHNRLTLAKLTTKDALEHPSLGCHYKEKSQEEQQIC